MLLTYQWMWKKKNALESVQNIYTCSMQSKVTLHEKRIQIEWFHVNNSECFNHLKTSWTYAQAEDICTVTWFSKNWTPIIDI